MRLSPYNIQLRELYDQGKERNLWKNLTEAAWALGMPERTFGNQYNGQSKTRGVLNTIKLLKQKLGVRPRTEKSSVSVGSLFQDGKSLKLWRGIVDCAELIDVDRGVLSEMIKAVANKLSSRKRTTYQKICAKLKAKLPKVKAEVPVAQIETTIGREVPAELEGITASTMFDRLLAGVAEFRDQNLNGVRFVLTRKNFRQLKGTLTKEEAEDTKLLIEELRRRFNLMTQIESEQIRAMLHKALGSQLDELFLAYRLLKEVVPTAALSEIEAIRAKFGHLTLTE